MNVKKVFNTRLGVEISQLGFGAMRLPTLENGKIDRPLATQMVERAYEAGINYFDTAHPYHNGESQVFLGEVLKKYPRNSFHFATKMPTWKIDCKQTMEDIFNEQLVNCQMDCFDFYLMHGLGETRYGLIDKFGIYDYLLEQKKLGRIKFLGFSYHGNYETFKRLFDNYKWDFAMIQYNYVDEIMLETGKFYDIMVKHDVPCMVMGPVRGKFLANPPQPALDIMQSFNDENFDGAEQYSPSGWALRWCRSQSNVAVTLSGMSNMEQLEENIRTFAHSPDKLTDAETAMLARATDAMLAIKTIPCTYCGYCTDCPKGVSIPRIFEIYNQYNLFPNQFRAGIGYGRLARDGGGIDLCTNCGICSPLCPQKIAVPETLAEIHNELEQLRQKYIGSV